MVNIIVRVLPISYYHVHSHCHCLDFCHGHHDHCLDNDGHCYDGDIPIFLFPMYYCSTCIPLLVIPTPDIQKIKIEVSNMFRVLMLIIPIPDI